MKENTANKVQISFRVDEQIRANFDIRLAKDRRDKTEVLNELVRGYLDGQPDPTSRPTPKVGGKTSKWHELLDTILESSDRGQAQIVQQQLQLCADAVKRNAPEVTTSQTKSKKAS